MTHTYKNDLCVEEVLEKIVHAQKKASKCSCPDCDYSCKTSIKELLHPNKSHSLPAKNTVPFILYTSKGMPFKADGVFKFRCSCCNEIKFHCVSTFIFKVLKVKDGCARLELLAFHNHNDEQSHCDSHFCSPCEQINHQNVEDLCPTGICINVDLSCFCAIQCLPAIFIPCDCCGC